jgi:hypothetical protein
MDERYQPAGNGLSSVASPVLAVHNEIASRMGVLPNFFRLAPGTPEIGEAFWGFAKFAYLDSPLPSLFKERLFVHVSRYCEVRYCLGRHLCFLVGRGRVAGDAEVPALATADALRLLKRSFTPHTESERHVGFLRRVVGPLVGEIQPDSELETALLAVCTSIFLNPAKAGPYLPVLRRLLGIESFEYLLVFIGFIRMAHYWTQVHPELAEEEDLKELMAQLEEMAWALAWDSKAGWSVLLEQVTSDMERLKNTTRRWP